MVCLSLFRSCTVAQGCHVILVTSIILYLRAKAMSCCNNIYVFHNHFLLMHFTSIFATIVKFYFVLMNDHCQNKYNWFLLTMFKVINVG